MSISSDQPRQPLRLFAARLRAKSPGVATMLALFAVPLEVGSIAAGAEAVIWHLATRQAQQQADITAVVAASKRASGGTSADCAATPRAANGSDAGAQSCGKRRAHQIEVDTDKRIQLIE